ncbi:ribonuclease H family protein [Paraburkholderia sp. SIMBA_050]
MTVIADASFDHDTGAGGYGYWAVSERGRKSGGGPFKSASRNNNVTEMMAIVNGVHMAFVNGVALDGDAILAQTDCQAAILAFEGRRASLQIDEILMVEAMRKLMLVHKATIRYRHVKGHTSGGEPRLWVNNLCDSLAKAGMREARDAMRKRPRTEPVGPPKPQKHRSVPPQRRAEREQDQNNRRTFAFQFDHEEWNRYVMDPRLSSIPPWEEQEPAEQPVARNSVGLSDAA